MSNKDYVKEAANAAVNVKNVKNHFEDAKETLMENASHYRDKAEDMLKDAGSKIKDNAEYLKENAAELPEELVKYITKNPLKSVIIAASVGLLAVLFAKK